MKWDRTTTIGLAKHGCTACEGRGLEETAKGELVPCNCVLRKIFRACYARFRNCVNKEKFMSQVSLVPCKGRERKMTYARLDEEYIADFCLVARRHLTDFDHMVFRFHFVLGGDWHLCCRQMKIDRGVFFHSVYRIQRRLGRVFRELEPFSLFPLDEYFAGRINQSNVVAMPAPETRKKPVRPPLRKSA